ncbi:MAG TPA: SDR family NAD(P)-dependent oxidoreductase, partial [Gemmatimonadaceae bacterium]|nr:SDR family NAD(P)-dependent oxidoreductase [Gemmatimonadaceae bacterium]
MDLSGKVALITGAKRIGAVVAEALAARGVNVALSYARSEAEALSAADAVGRAGARAHVFQADLSSPDTCRWLVDTAAETFGRLDILINMASV